MNKFDSIQVGDKAEISHLITKKDIEHSTNNQNDQIECEKNQQNSQQFSQHIVAIVHRSHINDFGSVQFFIPLQKIRRQKDCNDCLDNIQQQDITIGNR